MWFYKQKTGNLLRNDLQVGHGYSGNGDAKNNPEWQSVRNRGPIPCGKYQIMPPVDTDSHGPYCLALVPISGPEDESWPVKDRGWMYGRSGFLIHGDSIKRPGTASLGCIILSHLDRAAIWTSEYHELTVVPE